MKKYIYTAIAGLFVSCEALRLTYDQQDYEYIAETGDLIFQTEIGRSQAFAIQAATFSPYNHVGVVIKENNKFYVYEAHGPVKKISLTNFQCKGINTLLIMVAIQFALGVFTILLQVPVWLGVAHQIGAFFLLSAMTFTLHRFSK